MILSDRSIGEYMTRNWNPLVVAPLAENAIQPASIDVRLSDTLRLFRRDIESLDPRNKIDQTELHQIKHTYTMAPREFLLASTIEAVGIPSDLVARVEGKSSIGRLGVLIHVTAGYIDPGFRGTITLELANLSNYPVILHAGMFIAQLSFVQMTSIANNPYGSKNLRSKYQDQTEPTASKAHEEYTNTLHDLLSND
jgi:dCTP deaminase